MASSGSIPHLPAVSNMAAAKPKVATF